MSDDVQQPQYRRGSAVGADCANCPFAVDGKPERPVFGIGPDDPHWIAVGEGPGVHEERLGSPFCLVPETLVLMADLTWKPLGHVNVGDEIITLQAEGAPARGVSGKAARAWVVATVTHRVDREAPVFKVDATYGSITGSADHPVLTWHGKDKHRRWLRIDQLMTHPRRRSRMVYIGGPWVRLNDYNAAYLAGFLDGEGHVLGSRGGTTRRVGHVGFTQNAGPTCDRAIKAMEALGFDHAVYAEQRRKGVVCRRVHVRGGFMTVLRFLGEVRPERLITDLQTALRGRDGAACRLTQANAAAVTARTSIGMRPVIDITTTAGSFIANGFVVHNCGPTGELVNRALRETRVGRGKLWVTNATLCIPRGDRSEASRHAAAAACSGRLRAELAEFPERPVLAMGNVATKSLVGDLTTLPITEISGSHFETDLDSTGLRDIIPTVHPAAILRGGGKQGKGDKGPEKTGGHVADLAFWALKHDILKARALAEFRAGRGPDIRLRMRVGEEIEIELESRARARALVRSMLARAREHGRLTIDYETGVDNPQRNDARQAFIARIRLVGLASGGRAISVPWRLLDAATIQAYRRVLADPTITKCGHNINVYDRGVHGNQHYRFVDAGEWHDTMLLQHAAWPGAPKKLQKVVSQYYAVRPWKSEFRDGGDTEQDEAIYNAQDALGTEAAVAPGLAWVKRNKVEAVYDVDRAKGTFAAMMHEHGYYVDPDVNDEILRRLSAVIDSSNAVMKARCAELGSKFVKKLAAEQAKTQRKADSPDYDTRVATREAELETKLAKGKFEFSPSNDWHAVAFLRAAGVSLWQTTPTGRTATSASILEGLAQHPEVAQLLLLRANETLYETEVRMFNWTQDSQKHWRPPFVQDDLRCHPRWSPVQISGRFSSIDPASSNRTQGDETNKDISKRLPNVRREIVAPPGRGIVAFDMAQLEARLMAVQSGDPFLCRIFAEGLDPHHEFGVLVFPGMKTLDKKSEEYNKQRDLTKRFEYGAIYGGSDVTVHKAVSADEPMLAGSKGLDMVRAAIVTMKKAVAGVFAWQQRLLQQTSLPPHTLRSYLLGRMRVFPLGNPPPTDVANNPNQFAGADIMDTGLVRLLPRLEKYKGTAFPILHQHDAIYFECNEADMLALAKDIKDSFETEVKAVNGQMIAFPVEVKVGYAYHSEPSDKQKAKYPELIWPVGRPGLVKVSV